MKQDLSLPRRRSVRLPHFDYSQPAAYFLTICSHEKRHIFGTILGREVRLSAAGHIVDECWRDIANHFPNVRLPIYVIMPNHIHGIVVVHTRLRQRATDERSSREDSRRLGAHRPGSIPTIVRSFKAIAARRIRERLRGAECNVWQRGYYERIIRNEPEFHKTCDYIRLNPANWANDEENS